MTRFNRITTDQKLLAGQATIRSLSITVSEVVQKIISGKSVSDLLNTYPELEIEDIFQAMAYAIGDLLHSINIWRFQAMKSLNTAHEYEELLFNPELNTRYTLSNEQKRQFSRAIIEETENVEDAWYYLREWANINYVPKLLWQPRSIYAVIDKVLDHNRERTNIPIEVQLSPDLPPVRGNNYLEDGLYQIIADDSSLPIGATSIGVSLQTSDRISLVIQRQAEPSHLEDIGAIMPFGSPLSMAAIIIHQHGGTLSVNEYHEGIEFQFDIPIWRG